MNAIKLYRIGRWCYQRRVPFIPKLTYYLIFLIYNSAVPMSVEIGEGTLLGHGGIGVVLHPRCRIGRRVIIGAQVTIGGRSRLWDVPTIEDDCCIGAGAKILGPIRIGEGAVIGANAVVIHDVPPHSVVAGVPARVIRKNITTEDYAYL
jgi:serine O-acetyltransferase